MRSSVPLVAPALDDDGYSVVRELLGPAEVEAILAALETLRATRAELRPAGERTESGTRHLYELDARIPAVADLVTSSQLTELVGIALGRSVEADQISARTPQPGFGGQRLHADAPPRLDDGPCTVVTAIVALCPIDAGNGGTRLVPGSHRRPDLQRRAGALESHPDEIVPALAPGDALVFDGHLLHSGTENRSDADRPALQIVWRR